MLLTVFVLIAALSWFAHCEPLPSPASSWYRDVSPPDIYPDRDNQPCSTKEIRVQIVTNTREAVLHYVVTQEESFNPDCSSPTYDERRGDDIRIFKPGRWWVKALACPTMIGRVKSTISNKSYCVVKSDILPPTASPDFGNFRGEVAVTLASPQGLKVFYRTMRRAAGDDSIQFHETDNHAITLKGVGSHYVEAYAQKGDQSSPFARFHYEIKPPLVYDVTTNCAACKGIPTVNEPFTIWLQNPNKDATLFLTTSRQGCARQNHIVDNTCKVTVDVRRRLNYLFVATGDPGSIYVCIKEGDDPPIRVKRRDGSDGFDIQDAKRPLNPKFAVTATDGGGCTFGGSKKASGELEPPAQGTIELPAPAPAPSSVSMGSFFLIVMLAILMVAVVKVLSKKG